MLNYQNSNLNMSKIVDLTLNMMNTRFDIDGINYKKDTSMDLLDVTFKLKIKKIYLRTWHLSQKIILIILMKKKFKQHLKY